MLAGEELAGASESGLDLVADQQGLVLTAQLVEALEIALGWNDDPALALDRLDEDPDHVGVHRVAGRLEIPVGQQREARREGTEAVAVLRVVGEADDRRGATVEVAGEDQDLGLAVRHALDLVAPLARGLDRGLHRLGTRVHGQHPRVAGQLAHLPVQRAQLVVAERPRGQRHLLGLLDQRAADPRVGVALVDRGVGGEEVEVLVALDVPDPDALGALDHHVQRVVVVRSVGVFQTDEFGRFGVRGLHWAPRLVQVRTGRLRNREGYHGAGCPAVQRYPAAGLA